MTPFVPIAMFGWLILSIFLFVKCPPRRAVLYSIIGGVLFLPWAEYDFPIIDAYSKNIAIALGIVLGESVSGIKKEFPLRFRAYDIPMIAWCFIVPFATSLSNDLGLYDGFTISVQYFLKWGVFYWAGRRYFQDRPSIRDLSRGMIAGGMIYVPFILFELRMSPLLSKRIYGVFPTRFTQLMRYGGYRPIVFMQHALMVALWMAAAAIVAYWLWRTKQAKTVLGLAIALAVAGLAAMTILCKSGNGWIYLILGILSFAVYNRSRSPRMIRLILLVIPLYLFSRIYGIISYDQIQALASRLFDHSRIESLVVRLYQEDLFGARAMLRPLFGWGEYQRGWPRDPSTGGYLLQVVDSFWVIIFSSNGLLGLASVFLALGIGPWIALSPRNIGRAESLENNFSVDVIALCLVVIFFLLDCLMNAMINPFYTLCAGALVSNYCERKDRDAQSLA